MPWLIVAHARGMHSRLFNRLLASHGHPENILACDAAALEASGAGPACARQIAAAGRGRIDASLQTALENCLAWLAHDAHHIIHRQAPAYPVLLTEIPDPPPLLYVRGNADALHMPLLAMVGSRRPSVDGRRNARRFARQLSRAGVGICSGLALGIDVASHEGALEGGGLTVAVLGTGIDRIYPAANGAMFDRIAERGALVSEFNPGTPPLKNHFPRRNRIISGLSMGVLVVEAGLKSGSMITARFALEQGREVFAIPGTIHNPMARGCHHLINQGARLTEQVADIVPECGGILAAMTPDEDGGQASGVESGLPPTQARVLAAVGSDPVSMETLATETGLAIETLSAALSALELEGRLARTAGGYRRPAPD